MIGRTPTAGPEEETHQQSRTDPRGARARVPARPPVVGVGRSAASRGVVTWAADEAARTGRALRLVHVLERPPSDPDEGPDC
ncbi:universal stress protein [Kitasatospora sp. NPDC096128]|uniref:universal stress protein n=1 Tax=Kitasatospora sp. NPDC096128 TaxID=3155547 RepID=UPI003331F140